MKDPIFAATNGTIFARLASPGPSNILPFKILLVSDGIAFARYSDSTVVHTFDLRNGLSADKKFRAIGVTDPIPEPLPLLPQPRYLFGSGL